MGRKWRGIWKKERGIRGIEGEVEEMIVGE